MINDISAGLQIKIKALKQTLAFNKIKKIKKHISEDSWEKKGSK